MEQTGPVHVASDDIAEYLAATKISPKEAIQHLVKSLVKFVESEEYVRFASALSDDNSA